MVWVILNTDALGTEGIVPACSRISPWSVPHPKHPAKRGGMGWGAAATLLPLSGLPMSLPPATGRCPQTVWSWPGVHAAQLRAGTVPPTSLGLSLPPHSLGCWLLSGGCSTPSNAADPPEAQNIKTIFIICSIIDVIDYKLQLVDNGYSEYI